jgi:hypothetical protein
VIQVIGETSNKAGNPKKFVQTFVLAQQPSGYFVLNDIFRYIDEESDEEPAEPVEQEAPSAEVEAEAEAEVEAETEVGAETEAGVEAEAETEAEAPVPVAEGVKEPEHSEEQFVQEQPASLDAGVVVKKLEEVSASSQEPVSVNGDATPEPAAEEPAAAPEVANQVADKAVPDVTTAAQELAEETAQEPEKPKEPSPTPVTTRKPAAPAPAPAPASAAPAPAPAPAQPAKPMTWASRIAAAAGPAKVSPAMPLPKAAPVPAAARPAAAAPSASSQTTASSVQSTETAAPGVPAKEVGTEWQTAGSESKRQNRPQSISAPPAEKEGTLGYVKYVTDKVGREELEAALAQHGELAYFDINRQKVCLNYHIDYV